MIYLRTPEEKADPEAWWEQPDDVFFSAGACHILASAFVREHAELGYQPWLVRAAQGMRGSHIIAVNRTQAVDASGFHRREDFLANYTREIRRRIPEWRGEFVQLDQDPVEWDWCRANGFRHPSQFPHDPINRAKQFIFELYKRAHEGDPDGAKVSSADFPGGEALVAYFARFDGYERELAIAEAIIQITINGGPTQSIFDDIIQRVLRCPEGSMLCDMWRQTLRWGTASGLEVPASEPFPWH